MGSLLGEADIENGNLQQHMLRHLYNLIKHSVFRFSYATTYNFDVVILFPRKTSFHSLLFELVMLEFCIFIVSRAKVE